MRRDSPGGLRGGGKARTPVLRVPPILWGWGILIRTVERSSGVSQHLWAFVGLSWLRPAGETSLLSHVLLLLQQMSPPQFPRQNWGQKSGKASSSLSCPQARTCCGAIAGVGSSGCRLLFCTIGLHRVVAPSWAGGHGGLFSPSVL